MIWAIAWRNIWRNKMRSIILIIAIALGLTAGIFTIAFMQGAIDTRINSAIKTELAHLQIHKKEFLTNNDINLYLENTDELLENINSLESVKASSKRIISESFFISAQGTGGGMLIGIIPQQEKKVTDIWKHIIEGTYLKHNSKLPPVLIGEKLAKKLKLKTGSRINMQMVDKSGNISIKGYRVSGIYRTSNTDYDESTLFVKFNDLKKQLDMDSKTAHEIAILLKNNNDANILKNTINKFINKNNITETWKEISPEMSLLTDSMDQYMYIFIIIILLALCFGIINTMLMSVLERTKEIGVLMAVGMSKRNLFFMIILESVLLTVTGGIIGIMSGITVTKIFETTPIDLSMFAEGLEKYGFAAQIYTSLNNNNLISITILILITGFLSAIYPAHRALSLNPAEATQTE